MSSTKYMLFIYQNSTTSAWTSGLCVSPRNVNIEWPVVFTVMTSNDSTAKVVVQTINTNKLKRCGYYKQRWDGRKHLWELGSYNRITWKIAVFIQSTDAHLGVVTACQYPMSIWPYVNKCPIFFSLFRLATQQRAKLTGMNENPIAN